MNTPLLLLLLTALPLTLTAAEPARLTTTFAEQTFLEREAGHVWTVPEIAQLEKMAGSSADPTLRLRATRILIESAGQGRATEKEQPIVDAAFRYLEQHPDDLAIRRLLATPRMTHYTVSSQTNGSIWFLIEAARSPDGGGLNFRWDAEKKQVELDKAWGSLAQK